MGRGCAALAFSFDSLLQAEGKEVEPSPPVQLNTVGTLVTRRWRGWKANMSDPVVCSFITKILCAQGGRVDCAELPQHVELSDQQLKQILAEAGKERFLVQQEGLSCPVLAVTSLRLCRGIECVGCKSLHFCKNFLKGRCHRPTSGRGACKYSHDVFSEENRKVLKNHELSGLNEDELRILLLQNDPFLLPDVCQLYNKREENCPQKDDCKKLHICRYFLRGNCRFPRCKKSHNLMQPNILNLLLGEGVDDKMAWNIQTICAHKTAELAKELGPQKAPPLNPKAAASGEKKKSTVTIQGEHSTAPPPAPFPSFFGNLSPQQGPSLNPPAAISGEKKKPSISIQGEHSTAPPPALPPSFLGNLSPQLGPSLNPPVAISGEKKKPSISIQGEHSTTPPPAPPSFLGNLSPQQGPSLNPTAAISGEKKKPSISIQGEHSRAPPPAPPSFLGNLSPQQGPSLNPTAAISGEKKKPSISIQGEHSRAPPPAPPSFLGNLSPQQGVKAAPPLKSPQNEEKKKNNCEMIHYHLPYRWQINTGITWSDMTQMEEIEKAYCDPCNTSLLNPYINFKTMMSYVNPVRRLSTPSSVTKEARFVFTTKWLWYWKNDQGQWIEYGKQAVEPSKTSSEYTAIKRLFETTVNDFVVIPPAVCQYSHASLSNLWESPTPTCPPNRRSEGAFMDELRKSSTQSGSTLSSDDLENLFLSQPDGTFQFQAGSQVYEINFKDMIQRNLHYLTQREVQRRPKYVSSEDVKKKKGHRDHSSARIPEPAYPREWDKSALPEIGFKGVELDKTSSEYTAIEKLFQKTMKDYVIRGIRRIQNPSLWQVFQWQKDQMKKKKGGQDIEEKLLFHGTGSSNTEAICSDNFDWRICGTNGTVYGKGSYFARDAQYSHNYCQLDTKVKTMFVARVLVGDFVVGNKNYNRPPPKFVDMTNCYDSCVDRMIDPTVFVIFEKHQIYPAYVISYIEEKKCIVA